MVCANAKPFICHLNGTYASQFGVFENYANLFAPLCNDVDMVIALRQEACLIDLVDTDNDIYPSVDCAKHIKDGGANTNVWAYTAKPKRFVKTAQGALTDEKETLTLHTTIPSIYETTLDIDTAEFWLVDETSNTASKVDDAIPAPVPSIRSFKMLDLSEEFTHPNGQTIDLDGEAEDGVIIVYTSRGGTEKIFVGIRTTANLGVPLAVRPLDNNMPVTAVWHGRALVQLSLSELDFNDFELTVDFTNSTIDSTTDYISPRNRNDNLEATLVIDGEFDQYGLISGTTTVSQTETAVTTHYTGILTGLIGVDGAVGVFVSDGTGAKTYAGAFVANDKICESRPV